MRTERWIIEHLNKNADLNNPQTVEKFIKGLQRKDNYKARLARVYKWYCEYKKIEWTTPKFSRNTQEIKCPTHEKIEMIISDSGRILSLKLRLSKDTGLRPIEIFNLKVRDVDLQQRIIYPTTAKNGAPRKIKIPQQLTELLQAYINNNQRQLNESLFKGNPVTYGKEFREVRNRLAKKLNDETLKTVRLYDLRHYFATMDYQKFHDLKRTQYLMGHKHSSTTDIYTHLLDNGEEDEYTVKTANNVKEATDLIEHGFQYITEMDNVKIFKKRK